MNGRQLPEEEIYRVLLSKRQRETGGGSNPDRKSYTR